MNENDRTTLEQAIYEEMELTPEMIRSIRTLCGVCLCSFVESKAFKIAIVQAEQIFTVDKSRVLKYLGHLTPEEMNRVDDAVRASLALNPMGSIQRLPPIIRSTAAYAPPEVVDGKPPIYPLHAHQIVL